MGTLTGLCQLFVQHRDRRGHEGVRRCEFAGRAEHREQFRIDLNDAGYYGANGRALEFPQLAIQDQTIRVCQAAKLADDHGFEPRVFRKGLQNARLFEFVQGDVLEVLAQRLPRQKAVLIGAQFQVGAEPHQRLFDPFRRQHAESAQVAA